MLRVFYQNRFLKFSMIYAVFMGVWPNLFNNPSDGFKRLYGIYWKILFGYFIALNTSQYIQIVILMREEEFNMEEFMHNMCITFIYIATIAKIIVIKRQTCIKLIKIILEREKIILRSRDEGILEIYNKYAKFSQISNKTFFVGSCLVITFYLYEPNIRDPMFTTIGNKTIELKQFGFSAWLPFDKQVHHIWANIWYDVAGTIGGFFVIATDSLTFSLVIFPIGQLSILKHILRNFNRFADKVQVELNSGRNEALEVTQRECILLHKSIIQYVQDFNGAMKNMMLVDFLQSSMQMATIILQIWAHFDASHVILLGEFFINMVIRLFIYYRSVQEIMIQSEEVALAFYESNWMDHSESIKKKLFICIVRSQRCLTLTLGPFQTMSLDTFIGVLKATYSYMMVFLSFM